MRTRLLLVLLLSIIRTELAKSFAHPELSQTSRPLRWHHVVASFADSASNNNDNMYVDAKGVIFDIDGTLANSWKLGFDATLVILEQNNIPPISQEVYHECTRYATPERLARHCGLEPNDEDFEQVGAQLAQQFDDLYVGLVSRDTAGFYNEISQLLHGIPSSVALGALTNAAVRYAHAVLETNSNEKDVYYRFRSIRGADNVPEPKPSPAGLLQVCVDLGLVPSECVYIGDSPTDGAAAHAAGMPCVGVSWGSHTEESLKNAPFSHVCRTVGELRNLLPQ